MYLNNLDIAPVDLKDFFDRFPCMVSIKKLLDGFVLEYPGLLQELRDSIEKGTVQEIKDSAHKLKGVLINLSIIRGYYLALDLEKNSEELNKKEALAKVDEIKEELDKIDGFLEEQHELFR